jgi:hypothetical protein
MEISSINSALSAVKASEPTSLAGTVSLKMLDNTLDNSEALNEGLTKMMEHSVYPNLGSNIDVSV